MTFFEELGKTIADKSKVVVDKAKDMTEVIQLKSQISSERSIIEETYARIGRAYFDAHKNQTEDPYMDEFNQIKSRMKKIEALEEMVSKLEGTRVCAECGAKVDRNSIFCGKCGARLEGVEPEEKSESVEVPMLEAAEDDKEDEAEE